MKHFGNSDLKLEHGPLSITPLTPIFKWFWMQDNFYFFMNRVIISFNYYLISRITRQILKEKMKHYSFIYCLTFNLPCIVQRTKGHWNFQSKARLFIPIFGENQLLPNNVNLFFIYQLNSPGKSLWKGRIIINQLKI